MSTGRYY